jgi:phenylalanyl-tRNA synthetase beta chain
MTALGFFEIYSYSFTNEERACLYRKNTELVRIANPLSQEQEYMRADTLGSMLGIVSKNKDYKIGKMQGLYEIANVYERKSEKSKLSGLIYGGDKETVVSYIKGTMEALFAGIGIKNVSYKKESDGSAGIYVEQKKIGYFVSLDNEEIKRFKIKSKGICFFELDLPALASLKKIGRFHAIPKFPGSERDLNFVVEEKVTVGEICEIIDRVKSSIRIESQVIDVYRGKGLAEGKKSVSIRFIYQSGERTLTDKEVDDDQDAIIKKIKDTLGGILRGEGS